MSVVSEAINVDVSAGKQQDLIDSIPEDREDSDVQPPRREVSGF